MTFTKPRPQSALMHSDTEWAARYLEIERLYVRERRKLRYIVEFMEQEHNFKATPQMYKKRFAKWGFQKNTKRSTGAAQTSGVDDICTQASSAGEMGSIQTFSGTSTEDELKLMFLTSVRTWSGAFFEFVRLGVGNEKDPERKPSEVQPRSIEANEISFAFMLVIELLDRGHGELAGRMARKAFLLVEELLTFEGPALVWNLLGLMHNMVMLRHLQLFRMLLSHLDSLVLHKVPETHPLSTILRTLRRLVVDPTNTVPDTNSLSDSLALSSLLEQAWIFNAKMLFDHFDPNLIQLYWRIFWDSCSISLPSPIVGVAVQRLNQTEARQNISVAAKAYLSEGALTSNSVELLHASSITTLRDHGKLILSDEAGGDTTRRLGILAGLLMAKILEEGPPVTDCSDTAGDDNEGIIKVPRIHAIIIACTIRVLMDFNTDSGISDTVDRIRTVLALREYAQGEVDPQVVREMWLLEDALVTAGEYKQAKEVRQEVIRRLYAYLQTIPVGSA